MLAFERLAEEKIRGAIAGGEFDNLPGKGKPLDLDEPFGVRPEDRLAHLVLKNSGFLPEHLQLRKELENDLKEVEKFLQHCRSRLGKRLEQLRQITLLDEKNQAAHAKPAAFTQVFFSLKRWEQNAHWGRGKGVSATPISQRLRRLRQTDHDERRWLRERLGELANQIEDTAKRLHETMVEKEIRDRRESLLLRHSPFFSRLEIFAQFNREFPATPREFD